MEKRLTIAIPVYNRSTYVREALESALRQTVPVSILVVDNASTKFDFEALVASYGDARIRYVRNEKNLGMAGNWNRCIELCETPYLCILHDDDILADQFIEKVGQNLEGAPAIVFTRNGIIDEKGDLAREITAEEFRRFDQLRAWCIYNRFHTGITFHAETARLLGKFRPSLPFNLDLDLWVKLALKGGFRLVEDLLGWYRVYSSSDRATSAFEANFETIPRIHIQLRRNIRAYSVQFPNEDPPKIQYCYLSFRDLLHFWRILPKRRAVYALAVFVNSKSPSFSGKMLRIGMRFFGKVVCAFCSRFQKVINPK